MTVEEASTRIEPARIEHPSGELLDLSLEIVARAERLGRALHPETAAQLARTVRIMNTYYSNLIEGHNTRPREIEQALQGIKPEDDRRDLKIEAVAHYRVQQEIDEREAAGMLPDPASIEFIRYLHRAFYDGATVKMLTIVGNHHSFVMTPGEWRRGEEQDVEVGRHLPPASDRVPDFMAYFHQRFAFQPAPGEAMMAVGSSRSARLFAMATAHHRFNYIHPFPDGNGRVSRLMSHAMAQAAGVGAHGLWSISRGLARGLAGGPEGRAEYKQHMAWADEPRQGDRDGRGNLSLKGLELFTSWFLRVCLDQLEYMDSLFDLKTLGGRLKRYVYRQETLPDECAPLLQEALVRGEFERGEASRITGLPDRSARRVLKALTDEGLLASVTEKGPVSLRFPVQALDTLFPRLYPEDV
ncbi:Fic family protein [Agrobacterium tumefaciens]|uniref:Fic family protein n=1 Tax=Agrobacterium tumefaciens TaxID=358 RepID=UPI00122FF791|nr:Fic family protein [Agrobacterium tumefaciens]